MKLTNDQMVRAVRSVADSVIDFLEELDPAVAEEMRPVVPSATAQALDQFGYDSETIVSEAFRDWPAPDPVLTAEKRDISR